MRWFAALLIYRLLLPLLFIAAFPDWIVRMMRRGGQGTRLGERAAVYLTDLEGEPCGAVHVHAVSVGEALLAVKLIREWRVREPERRFVLATGTATGHAVATAAHVPGLRVTYAPLDFPLMVRSYLKRFEPEMIVLIEGEAWPHLLLACHKRKIPVALVNARMSPRSARRYRRFAAWVCPLFSMLDAVAVQEPADADAWQALGVCADRIHRTGSLKFDPTAGERPRRREEFQEMISAFGGNRPVVLAASTHEGEEEWIASIIRKAAPHALPVIVPRHAERRDEVAKTLTDLDFKVILRTSFHTPSREESCDHVLVIDTTGELRDWIAHADAVIIGKSFRSTGGQSPADAILAGKPVVFGPHMENFEPLAGRLANAGGAIRADDEAALIAAIHASLDATTSASMSREAAAILAHHDGATQRMLDLLIALPTRTN